MSQKTAPRLPVEPILELDDIQGIVAPGFFKPHQMLLGTRYSREPHSIASLKAYLAAAC
jgi:hypothetical protein